MNVANLHQLLEKVIESPEMKRAFLKVELARVMNNKYQVTTQKPIAVNKAKKYKVVLTIESIEQI